MVLIFNSVNEPQRPVAIYRTVSSLDSGHLDHPSHVWRVQLVLNEPLCQTFPLVSTASVDRQSRLCVLILTLLQIMSHLLEDERMSRLKSVVAL